MALTGNRSTDFVLLVNIPDEKDFLSLCQTDKKAAELCRDNNLFLSRLTKYYPNTIKWKPKTRPWKKYYLECMYYIGKLKELKFNYTNDAKAPPSEYYYYMIAINYRDIIRCIRKGYMDLFLHLILHREHISINIKSKIFKYSPMLFIEKYFDEIFKPKDLVYGGMQLLFDEAAKGGKWDNYHFLLNKFPDDSAIYVRRHLAYIGEGGNKDIINFARKKYSPEIGPEAVNLIISMGAYNKLHTETGDKYFNKIQHLNELKIIEDADTYTTIFSNRS